MKSNEKSCLLLVKEDYELLLYYTNHKKGLWQAQYLKPGWLYQYLEEACVLPLEEFPEEVVRLNTTVALCDIEGGYIFSYTVVRDQIPEQF